MRALWPLALMLMGLAMTVPSVAATEHDLFDSPDLSNNETFSHTFDEAGTYTYHCTPHQQMEGTVTVSEDAAISGSTNVTIADFAFSPMTITVRPGTTVEWKNNDTTDHTVTEDADSPGPSGEGGGGSSPGIPMPFVVLALMAAAVGLARHRRA